MAIKRRVSLNEFVAFVPKYFDGLVLDKEQIRGIAESENLCVPNILWTECKYKRGVWDLGLVKTAPKPKKIEQETEAVLEETQVPVKLQVLPDVKPKLVKTTLSFIPIKDNSYVAWGNFSDIESVVKSAIFYPVFVTGLSGNGKTTMIEEVCARTKREFIRANITIETDEDDLLGGFRLVDGETVWHDGPVVEAMKRGAILLLDEVDLASHKIMCLQPILEGKPIYLKKIGQMVYPKAGFNIFATANTKGKGSDDGRFIGTNLLNEAFLDRFPVTMFQEYPNLATELKILKRKLALHNKNDDEFINNLAKWGLLSRKLFDEGGIDEVITTRRLINVVSAYVIFGKKLKAINMCIERFDSVVRDALLEAYTKVDKGDFEEPENSEEESAEQIIDVDVDSPPWK